MPESDPTPEPQPTPPFEPVDKDKFEEMQAAIWAGRDKIARHVVAMGYHGKKGYDTRDLAQAINTPPPVTAPA